LYRFITVVRVGSEVTFREPSRGQLMELPTIRPKMRTAHPSVLKGYGASKTLARHTKRANRALQGSLGKAAYNDMRGLFPDRVRNQQRHPSVAFRSLPSRHDCGIQCSLP
jgi:hypothetical protein